MMKNTIAKTIAGGLIVSTIVTSTTNEAHADAAAIMETAVETSAACPYIAPIVITGAAVITGVTTVIGIKNKAKQTDDYIYQSLGHLPDHWRPNSVIEKINPNGRIVQRRFYDAKGKPRVDIDLNDHGTPEFHPFNHGGAHAHEYRGTKRLRGRELTEDEYQKFVRDFDSKAADKMRVQYTPDENK
jgi:hypothetical protein